jgi:hypothetical protein
MNKYAFSQVAQHALVGAGIGGTIGASVGYLRGDPKQGRGRSMLMHGLGGAAVGGAIGAGSGAYAQKQNLTNIQPLDPAAAKRMGRIATVLRGYSGLSPDVHQHVNEYSNLANSATLNQSQVDRMQSLAAMYETPNAQNPEHVSQFFRSAAHRYEPKVAVAAWTHGADLAFDRLGL